MMIDSTIECRTRGGTLDSLTRIGSISAFKGRGLPTLSHIQATTETCWRLVDLIRFAIRAKNDWQVRVNHLSSKSTYDLQVVQFDKLLLKDIFFFN